MKKNPYKTEEFKLLKKEWYEKLEKNGFKDIEKTTVNTTWLDAWHNFRFKGIPIVQRISTEDYYHWAQGILFTYLFKNKTHRLIWELHCEGKSRRQIAGLIKNETPCYKPAKVGNIINEIKRTRKGTRS